MRRHGVGALFCCLAAVSATTARAQTSPPPKLPTLPVQTSRYNRGGFPGRYRDAQGKVARFALKSEKDGAPVRDGGGREIGRAHQPVMLNVGAEKQMVPSGSKEPSEPYLWAWQTEAGSGWIARSALTAPPPVAAPDNARNPTPPGEAAAPLRIDAATGRRKLAGLRHTNSQGVIPQTGGNKGEHYAGRSPGARDYVYLLFAVPNVRGGGTAQDSLPDDSLFVPALDEKKQPIQETMTMYRDGDLSKPVPVTFLYGRMPGGDRYGWLARANVGDL